MSEVEKRFCSVPMAVVEEEERAGKKKKKLSGYAARFNSLSDDLGGFREIIKPGAFDRALREKHDVRALFNHDPNIVLGRAKAGTLVLSVDDKGLRTDIDLPDTQAGRDIMESVTRGDIDGMSFAFRVLPDGDDWRTEGGGLIRELLDLELLDVSPVAYPAYPATQVSARAMDRAKAVEAPTEAPEGVPLDILRRRQRLASQ